MPLLAQKVLVSTCGVSGAGICAAVGLVPGPDVSATIHPLSLGAAQGRKPLFTTLPSDTPVFAINIASADGAAPELSIIVVNTLPSPDKDNVLAHELLSLLPPNAEVWVATSVQLIYDRKVDSPATPFSVEAVMYGAMQLPDSLSGVGTLPDTARIQDGFLAALLHFIHAMHVPCCCLIIPDHSTPNAAADTAPQARREHATKLAEALNIVFQPVLQFAPEKMQLEEKVSLVGVHSQSVRQDSGGGDVMYM